MRDVDISEMERVYQEQELGKYRIGFGKKPALIIIDFQYGLTDPQYNFGGGCVPDALKETAKLLKSVRAKKIPVIYSVAIYRKDFKDGGYFVKKVKGLEKLVPGSRNVQIDELIKPEEGDIIIYKQHQSCFAGTNLHSILTTLMIDTLLITGCSTSGCLRATTVDAMAHGYRPIVIEDCAGDRSLFAHKVNLMEMDAKVADVVKVKEVIEYLETL